MNRRQETVEFLRSHNQGVGDWPGFGSKPQSTGNYLENLWDKPEDASSGFGSRGPASRTWGQVWSSSVWGDPIGLSGAPLEPANNTHRTGSSSTQEPLIPPPGQNFHPYQRQPQQQQAGHDQQGGGGGGSQDGGLGFDPSSIASIWGSPKKQQKTEGNDGAMTPSEAVDDQDAATSGNGQSWSAQLFRK